MSTTRIKIGNGAYAGVNSFALAYSKAAAVRELRDRGLKRDDARKAVNEAAQGQYLCVRGQGFDVIEVQLAI
ncbi:hypothetical protein [Cupriavidus basilensis]|uniref:Uncharacterized protein n=1 Tax=Cupriavidus basilensis TaxID=68895 RepID=A0A0C4Y9B5_9BURK|nr:hypothetical protein [Cupriavidus basilensis]AJG18829.1 hypothetical protein RR42_m1428 [Cupriavidus basilensis]